MAQGYETLKNGTRLLTDALHTLSADSIYLADFCRVKDSEAVLDLGCGCGVILALFADCGHSGRLVGVENDTDACALFCETVDEAGLSNVSCVCGDARTYAENRKFDLVVSNPPYFNQGKKSAIRGASRHEDTLSLADVCASAARNLKQGGRLCVCFPSARLADIFVLMRQSSLEPKRLRLVRPRAGEDAYLALCEARYKGGVGLEIMPELLADSAEAAQITGCVV